MDLLLIVQWMLILAISIFVLVKGAKVFVGGASQIGSYFGMNQFFIGVLIVGMGTSSPELASSLIGVFSGVNEIVVANAVGSNIADILLIIGALAFWVGKILISRELIKTELPIFFIATIYFAATLIDGEVDRLESLLLLSTFFVYVWYLLVKSSETKMEVALKKRTERKLPLKVVFLTIFSLAVILIGASFAINMVVNIATALTVPIGLISITAIAIGTSLPELFISIQAIRSKKTELAIGNIFGANTFNMLVGVGLPGLFIPLMAGEVVMKLGLGIMLASSAILFVSSISGEIRRWEGLMMLILFIFFLIKLTSFL